MRLLLDACVPRNLRRELPAHVVSTAREKGWNRLQDNALLDAIAGEIDALIAVDGSLPFQQRLHDRPFAVIVLRARANRLDQLLPLVPAFAAGAQ